MKRRTLLLVTLMLLLVLLAGCRNETQNRIRRNFQDFANARMFITLYSLDGQEIFRGTVDGKVTRSALQAAGGGADAAGSYIYWFDESGEYHQTDLPYLVTTYDRDAVIE